MFWNINSSSADCHECERSYRTQMPPLGRFQQRIVRTAGAATAAICLSFMFGGAALAGGSVVDMRKFPGAEPVAGASTLMRYENAVDMTIHTTGLEPGHVYTVWYVIFNNPDACGDECGPHDFPAGVPGAKVGPEEPNPAVQASVLWAAGNVVGPSGIGEFRGRLERGNPPGFVIFGPGLVDPMNSDIHLLVRSHGRAMLGKVAEQMSTPQGLCAVTKPDAASHLCLDVQSAIHEPF